MSINKSQSKQPEDPDESYVSEFGWLSWPVDANTKERCENWAVALHRAAQEYGVTEPHISFYTFKAAVENDKSLAPKKEKREGLKIKGTFPSYRNYRAFTLCLNVIFDLRLDRMYTEENREYIRKLMALDKI